MGELARFPYNASPHSKPSLSSGVKRLTCALNTKQSMAMEPAGKTHGSTSALEVMAD